MRASLLFISCSLIILLPGCATIISGTTYPINIRTEPTSARITVTNKKGKIIFEGRSPATVKVQSGGGLFYKRQV